MVNIKLIQRVTSEYFQLERSGVLTIKEGYAWDGASGPAIDTADIMRASLVHDVLYQMIGMHLLDKTYRKKADEELYRICREDGMSWVRAQWVYRAVRLYGKANPDPEGARKVRTAG